MSAAKTMPGIHAAINAVMNEVGYTQKTGTVQVGGGYKYASEADLIRALRPHMVANGLTMYMSHIDRFDTDHLGKSIRCDVICTYTMTHAPSGEIILIQSIGSGVDNQDKAPYKAMTGAFKYALRETFVIETGNDPDESQDEPEPPRPQEQRAKPADYRWQDKDRTWFCAALGDLSLDYEVVAAATEGAGFGRPSAWARPTLQRAIDQLTQRSGGLFDAVTAYLATLPTKQDK